MFTYPPVTYTIYSVGPRIVKRLPLPILALTAVMAAPVGAQAAVSADVRVEVDPPVFSPNGDGRLDQTTISVEVDRPSSIRVDAVDPGGRVVRTWTETAEPGQPARIGWDGLGDGTVVPDGTYRILARGATAADLIGEAESQVSVDTTGPRLGWVGASPVLGSQPEVTFRFRAVDTSAPLQLGLYIDDLEGRIGTAQSSVSSGNGRISWRARTDEGSPIAPGTYFASLNVRDAAGNGSTSRRIPWRVHRPGRARIWREVPGAGRRVGITIDDCHNAGAWSSMLRTLSRRQAGATFFCPGRQVLANARLARRTIRDGHVIGSHGWDHALLTPLSRTDALRRLEADAEALWRVARRTTAPYFRPPYGAYDRDVVAAAGRSAHLRVVLWDVDPQDWRSPGVSSIVSEVLAEAGPGSIVLLHTVSQSATALPAVISGLRSRGLEPVGLPELFLAAGR